MLTVLWSTPRTGSTWYSQCIIENLKKQNRNTIHLRQYFNKFHLSSYIGDSTDLIYEYDKSCSYIKYQLEPLSKKIVYRSVRDERKLNQNEEELYRISLLEKTNLKRYPIFISQHVKPMNTSTYLYLKNKADKNIFIYRENLVDQLASYVVAMSQKKFVLSENERPKPVHDAEIPLSYLEDVYDRIKYWHILDKSGCEVVKYEDIDFSLGNYTKKQNDIKPIDQVSSAMKDKICELNEHFKTFRKNKIS
jgi:hypothetical protein